TCAVAAGSPGVTVRSPSPRPTLASGGNMTTLATSKGPALEVSRIGKAFEPDGPKRSHRFFSACSYSASVCAFLNRSRILELAVKKFWSSGTGGGMYLFQSH